MEEYILDELDYKILNLIANDTRVSFLEVSRICNISGASVHQRIKKMINRNVITGSEFKLNLKIIGYETCAYLSIQFEQMVDLDKVVEELKTIPEVVECNLTMGEYQLFIKVYAHNNTHLYDIVNRKIKPLGYIAIKTLICYGEPFHRQMTF